MFSSWCVYSRLTGCFAQDKRLLRLANKAKSLTELYKYASIVVPLAAPQRLPSTLQLDASSQWHTSALLAAAIETITLPSRLKDTANRDSLGTIADMLNTMGKQNIAGLQMSLAPQESGSESHPRQAGGRNRPQQGEDDEDRQGVQLDIDFSPSDQLDAYASRSNGFHHKTPKVFSQSLVWRGYREEEPQTGEDVEMVDEEDERETRRRRRPDETVTKRCVFLPFCCVIPTITTQALLYGNKKK